MEINIGNYRIRRYDSLNLCVEEKKVKQKAKNPYGRHGKKNSTAIIQNNSSNKIEYKWHLICYSPTLDYCLKKLVEECLTNNDEINTIQNLQDQIRQLNEKITKISEANNRSIEENIISNKDILQERADQIADQALY
jgi:TolA-binding protein